MEDKEFLEKIGWTEEQFRSAGKASANLGVRYTIEPDYKMSNLLKDIVALDAPVTLKIYMAFSIGSSVAKLHSAMKAVFED